MSIVNVWTSPERALVGVDTEIRNVQSGQLSHASKLFVLPHARLVVAGRGLHVFPVSVFAMLAQDPGVNDFDTACDAMAGTLKNAFDMMTAMLEHRRITVEAADSQQIIVAGWSRSQDGALASLWEQRTREDGFHETEIADPGYLCPWEGSQGKPIEPADAQAMVRLMRDQVDHVRTVCPPGSPIGGRLVLAEITRNAVTVTSHALARSLGG